MAIPLVRSTPQGDGTVRFMAQEKKGEKDTHAYITLYQSFILARRPIVIADSLLSQLKPTKCKLKCLRFADKLSHKLYSETFKTWCKHSTLGDTLIISDVSLHSSDFLWDNTAKMPSHHSLRICGIKKGSSDGLTCSLNNQLTMCFHVIFSLFFPPDVTGHCIQCRYQQWARGDFSPALLFGSHPEPGVILIIGPECGFLFCTWLNC